ncbi:MAG TPA: WXG100 family type VII secretion target [Jatrophihabitans sp.]|jgi:WXG100 family type VII secretion target
MSQASEGFRADLAALDELTGRLTGFDRRASAVATELEQDVRRLDAQWSGAAARAHAVAHRDWAAAHERLRRAAAELTDLVQCAHANYADAAGANTAMWR